MFAAVSPWVRGSVNVKEKRGLGAFYVGYPTLFFSLWVWEIFMCIGDSLTKVKVVKVRKVIKVRNGVR